MERLSYTVLVATLPVLLSAQAYIKNASFEGKAQDATVPAGWFACEAGTTPDILPGPWGVYEEAAEGETYVGLITREDGTWESIGQRLSPTLKPKECYTFTLAVAHSQTYAGYNNPLRLRIWGGTARCGKDQMLLETGFIREPEWEEFEVQFVPKKPINYILVEAFYKDGNFSYRGNILIDDFSPIKKCVRAELME
ncbi:MAG: carbohydrate binding domain-containing protein [Phaeodactylibacter sp.]|nr:carbohydrate binding domain-containing protein [Phaeodactylibacter sp.]MCB9273246.1 carbohydrate binding domain-containing protein [Lewinellaceae bacterium]